MSLYYEWLDSVFSNLPTVTSHHFIVIHILSTVTDFNPPVWVSANNTSNTKSATAFKFATSNSFRFRYVRQLSSSLRPTAFDSVTCDSFQVRYVQQLSIPLRATAFKFATSNSFRFRYVRQLSSSISV